MHFSVAQNVQCNTAQLRYYEITNAII